MESLELPLGLALAGLIVTIAAFYAVRQRHTIRQLRGDTYLPDADRRYLRAQVMRRLLISALLVLVAGFLVGSFFIDDPSARVGPDGDPAAVDKDEARSFASYWIVILVALLAFTVLAVMDMWATARYGWRHFKQLESDRRAMLEAEAARRRFRPHELN